MTEKLGNKKEMTHLGRIRTAEIINSTSAAHHWYIMHEVHYHKHGYLYPVADSLLCAPSEKRRSTWVSFKQLIVLWLVAKTNVQQNFI